MRLYDAPGNVRWFKRFRCIQYITLPDVSPVISTARNYYYVYCITIIYDLTTNLI